MRDIEKAANEGNEKAQLALLELFLVYLLKNISFLLFFDKNMLFLFVFSEKALLFAYRKTINSY